MSEYLLQLVGKWISLVVVSTASFFQVDLYNKIVVDVKNNNILKSSEIVYEIIEDETIETTEIKEEIKENIEEEKKEEQPKEIVKKEEKQVVIVTETPKNNNEITETKQVVEETKEEAVVSSDDIYVGKLTAYGADCYGCGGEGNLACNTKNGGSHSLKYDGIYYADDEYGNVRILAAARDKFPCGTIIDVDTGLETITAVVLDTGGDMIKAWRNSGTVWMDLAFATESDARNNMSTRNGVKYTVKRWGW